MQAQISRQNCRVGILCYIKSLLRRDPTVFADVDGNIPVTG
jgi:hypothetical protein